MGGQQYLQLFSFLCKCIQAAIVTFHSLRAFSPAVIFLEFRPKTSNSRFVAIVLVRVVLDTFNLRSPGSHLATFFSIPLI
jgi:hypothetical protein